MKVYPYVNWGRIVADCPVPGCGDAREVPAGVKTMTCVQDHSSEVVWPPGMPKIIVALSERMSEKRRNWFPAGHPLAVALGQPHGQTVDELRRETEVGERADQEALDARRAALLAELKSIGVTQDEALAALKGV